LRSAADSLYSVYHMTCHQWAFRSFFLFGQQAVYSQGELAGLDADPHTFVGSQAQGWKMAFCERDLAIYLGLLLIGLLFARRRTLRWRVVGSCGVLIVSMAVGGFAQLFGWRESAGGLGVLPALLFGLAGGWLVLPRLESAIGLPPVVNQYAPDAACDPLRQLS